MGGTQTHVPLVMSNRAYPQIDGQEGYCWRQRGDGTSGGTRETALSAFYTLVKMYPTIKSPS